MNYDAAKLGLLVAALLVFIISTRQIGIAARFLLWIVGSALLAGCAYLAWETEPGRAGLLQAIVDASAGWRDSLLHSSLEANWRLVADQLNALFGVFVVFAAVVALLALIALTPGQAVERVTRPMGAGLLGAIAGAAVALAFVAIGFGGQTKRHVYFGEIAAADVSDGDTLRIGDVAMRIAGIDAPEYAPARADGSPSVKTQVCAPQGDTSCGQAARDHLAALVSGRIVACGRPPEAGGAGAAPAESFGRPVVNCEVRGRGEAPFDLARRMAEDGYAAPYVNDDGAPHAAYAAMAEAIAEAQAAGRGVWTSCVLPPDVWRGDRAAREAFRAGDTQNAIATPACRPAAPAVPVDAAPVDAAPAEAVAPAP